MLIIKKRFLYPSPLSFLLEKKVFWSRYRDNYRTCLIDTEIKENPRHVRGFFYNQFYLLENLKQRSIQKSL